MVRSNQNVYTVSLILAVDDEATFLELDNKENVGVVLEVLKGLIYDLDDVVVREIEVEYVGEKV